MPKRLCWNSEATRPRRCRKAEVWAQGGDHNGFYGDGGAWTQCSCYQGVWRQAANSWTTYKDACLLWWDSEGEEQVFVSSEFNAWFLQSHLWRLVHRHLYLLDNGEDDPHDRSTIPRANVSTVTGLSKFNFLANFSYVYLPYICQWHNPSGRTMGLGSTHPLTEMNTRCISWG